MDWIMVLAKEFVSIFGFIILFLFVRNNNKMIRRDKRLFYCIIVTGIAELIAFEAELWTAGFAEPTSLRILLSVIGYTLRPLLVYQLVLLTDKSQYTVKGKFLMLIPCILCLLCVSTAFFSHISFWYNSTNNFQRGILGYFPHVVTSFYFLAFIYVSCRHMERNKRFDDIISATIALFAVSTMLIDTIINTGALTRVAIMLCTFFAYVKIQNRALFSMIDDIPGSIARLTIRDGKYLLVSFNDSLCRVFGMNREELVSATRENAFSPLREEYRTKAEEAMDTLRYQDDSAFRFNLNINGDERCYSVAFKVTRRTENEIDIYGTMVDTTVENRMLDDLRMKNSEIDLLMEQIGKIVCIYDVPTRTLNMTEQYAKLRGFSNNQAIVPDETCSRHLISDEYIDQYIEFYDKIFAGEHSGNIVAKFISPDGTERWEETDFVTILDENGNVKRAIISIEDITKVYEEKLLLENYRSTLDALMGDDRYCILYDITGHRILAYEGGLVSVSEDFVNKSLEELTDLMIDRYIKDSDVEIVREFMSPENMVSSYEAGIMQRHIERAAVLPNGDEKWFRLSVSIDSINGKNIVATLLLEDIDYEYRTQYDLISRANYDTLTGLYTRNVTMREIENYLNWEGKDGTHALLMMDMDNLKSINDNLGHQFGDDALRNFADEIKRFFRKEDIIGRIGGDEFFAFVKNITGAVLSVKMHDLLHNLERIYSDKGRQVTATASIGIVMYHGETSSYKTLTELYAQADAALYKAKALGKNTFVFSDELDAIDTGSSDVLMKNDLISYSLKGVLNNLANGIAIFNITEHGEIIPVLCNEKLPKLLFIEQGQFSVHMSPENDFAIHPDDLEQARITLNEAIQTGNSVRKIFRMLKGDGEYRYVTVFSNVHRTDDGRLDLYCVFSDAEEAEQLQRIQELRRRQLEKKLKQVNNRNEAYVLLNITKNICIDQFQTHISQPKDYSNYTADEVLAEIAGDIAIEEYRREFCDKFNIDAFYRDMKDGIFLKEMRVPFRRSERSAKWFNMKTELSLDANTDDIELFIVFSDMDNEVRLEYVINRLLEDEYEYICQIDTKNGFMARLGETAEDGLSKEKNGKIKYNDVLPFGIRKLLPKSCWENGLEALSLDRIISELENKEKYNVVFPVTDNDGRGERLCQWCCEYMDTTSSVILMFRKNISDFLNYGYDPLTGLLGREGFYRELRRVLDEKPNERYFLAEIDLDNFGLINDEQGYSEGNRFIRQFGEDLRNRLTTKEKGCRIGHLEGDCFLIFAPFELVTRPEDLYENIAIQVNAYPDTYRLKLRMGVYTIDDTTVDAELMCDCAQLALNACKGRFGRYINYYTDDLKDRMLDEQLLASEMQDAIDTEQFEIWFQPQVNHADKGIPMGAEALVRWNHPERGLISPAVFIPLFEQNGFVYELDKYVWKHTCMYIRHWIDEGFEPLPISVNVSRLDILHPDFLDTISFIIEEQGIPYDLIHLEITESAFSDSAEKVMQVVGELINRGFTVAIDDFGSGYSSLSMLKSVPAQILKLDMRFFVNEGDAERNECIIESIIRMAKMLGMSVLAEGVEYAEQADFLHTVGCDYIQGYLYSKPLPYKDYMAYAQKYFGIR